MDYDLLEQASITEIPKYSFSNITKEPENLFNEDVIEENELDNWTIDDFIGALPETIIYKYDSLAGFRLYYSIALDDPCWVSGYETLWGDLIYESDGETPYDALKNLYLKLKDNEELE